MCRIETADGLIYHTPTTKLRSWSAMMSMRDRRPTIGDSSCCCGAVGADETMVVVSFFGWHGGGERRESSQEGVLTDKFS